MRGFAQMMSESGMDGGDMIFVLRGTGCCRRGLGSGWRRRWSRVRQEVDQYLNNADQNSQDQEYDRHGQYGNLDGLNDDR